MDKWKLPTTLLSIPRVKSFYENIRNDDSISDLTWIDMEKDFNSICLFGSNRIFLNRVFELQGQRYSKILGTYDVVVGKFQIEFGSKKIKGKEFDYECVEARMAETELPYNHKIVLFEEKQNKTGKVYRLDQTTGLILPFYHKTDLKEKIPDEKITPYNTIDYSEITK